MSADLNEREIEDDEDEDGDESSELTLVFTSTGTAVLEENGEGVWFSDDDDDFREVSGNEFLEAELDTAMVLNYLVDEELVEEDEKGDVKVEQEELDEEN